MQSNDAKKLKNIQMIMECLPKLTANELDVTARFLKQTVESRTVKVYPLRLVKN
jgi:hypothetical protein